MSTHNAQQKIDAIFTVTDFFYFSDKGYVLLQGLNPYSATLFLDAALLSFALFMNVCSDNASLFCNANVLRLLTAFCSLDLNKTFSKSVICIHYLSNKNKNSFQTILNLYLKSEYVTLFYWCLGRIDIAS